DWSVGLFEKSFGDEIVPIFDLLSIRALGITGDHVHGEFLIGGEETHSFGHAFDEPLDGVVTTSLLSASTPKSMRFNKTLKPIFLATIISSKVSAVPSATPLASAAILTGEEPIWMIATSFSGTNPSFLRITLRIKSDDAPSRLTASFLPLSCD